jgi:hypothetical protein
MRSERAQTADEGGQALVMGLIFINVVAVIVSAIVGLANANVRATTPLRTLRGSSYDADAALEAALATIRVDTNRGYVNLCPSYTPTFTLNSPSDPVRVDCFPIAAPLFQRRVVLSVCPTSVSAPCPDANSLLRAEAWFFDDQSFGRAVSVQTWSARS